MHHPSNESWPRLEGVVSTSSAWEGNTDFCFGACLFLVVSRTSTGDGCSSLLEPRTSDSKPMRKNNVLLSSISVHIMIKKGTAAPPKGGRGRQLNEKARNEGETAPPPSRKEGRKCPSLFLVVLLSFTSCGWRCFSLSCFWEWTNCPNKPTTQAIKLFTRKKHHSER